MNWKVLAIVLIVVVVLVGAYSFGFFQEVAVDDGTSEVAGSFDVSASVQSDFWDGFSSWLSTNGWWLCLCGIAIVFVVIFLKAKNKA